MNTTSPQSSHKDDSRELKELLEIFTPAQLSKIAVWCKGIAANGHGDVTVRFKAGHPRFIIRSGSEALARYKTPPDETELDGSITGYAQLDVIGFGSFGPM